ncbi:hypothetical protein OS493_021341 [Desmophyllum pertusum]|uniref:MYND-type domain-containing protein n=1 Tax=Desmophyllum pertusum TaxID=174260 RepID=A0A9W9ZC56_9CNID|nr:hypothetical protein OS493_021341 [Desmophyllum pertusum]
MGGLEAREGGKLVASENRIFDSGYHGVLIGPDAGECDIDVTTRYLRMDSGGSSPDHETSAHIERNVLSGNKCGGIYIGVNFSGRLHLESNIIRDHSGPWIQYQTFNVSLPSVSRVFSPNASFYAPPGEKNELYSNPPILDGNKEFNNKEGTYHPREVAQRLYSGCTYCRRSSDDVGRLMKCPDCHIASYCCKECQRKHRPKHETLCFRP